MVIEVRLYATLRQYFPSSSTGVVAVDVQEGITLSELISALEIDKNEVKMMMVNGTAAEGALKLTDGDRVGLFPPVGGG